MKRFGFFSLALLVGMTACQDITNTLSPTDPQAHGDGADGMPGSHFRLTHVNWTRTGTNTAEFTFVYGARTGYYFAPAPAIGSTHTLFDVTFRFGDGTQVTPTFTITFVDVANNWFEARATFSKTYAGPGPFVAYWEDCCRLSSSASPWSHRNNPDGSARIETIVDFTSAGSPASSTPAIRTCAPDAVCNFIVPFVAPGGQTIRYRMATNAEMGASQLPGASIDPISGVFSWNTTGAPLHASLRSVFSTMVVAETVVGTTVTTKSAVDFMIEITTAANAPPVFESPTPVEGTVFDISPGTALAFTVRASDPDAADVVTLGMLGAPPGATFPIPAAANPVQTNFSFTPTAGQLGSSFAVTVLATDQRGASASRSYTINVVAGTTPPPPPGACELVDFNNMGSHGTEITSFNLGGSSISVTVIPGGSNSLPRAYLFDSDITTGLDPDLRWQNGGICTDCQGLGNMLVIPDARGWDPHGDSHHGGTFRFTGFPSGWSFTELYAIDSDDYAPWTVKVNGTQVGTVPIGGDGSVMVVPLSANTITGNVEIWLPSSGAIDNLKFCR
jgi:hypothetical protein